MRIAVLNDDAPLLQALLTRVINGEIAVDYATETMCVSIVGQIKNNL